MTKPISATFASGRRVLALWLILVFIFAMTTILPIIVTCVEADSLNTFPVCSKCSCEYIPSTLEGLVVDVPQTANGNWLRFSQTMNSTDSVVTIFKSANPFCKVEAKLSGLKAPAFFMLLFPAGRDNSTLASTAWAPPGYICAEDGQTTAKVNLGQSAFSTGSELAIAFLTIERQRFKELSFQLLYRQWCDIQLPSSSFQGFELPSPPVDGQIRTANLRDFPAFLYPYGRSQYVWSISPPSRNCSVGVTFRSVTGTSSLFALNTFEDIYLGLTYKVATGKVALIRFQDVSPANGLLLDYRALECGLYLQNASSPDVEIFSWNNIAMPLQITSEWQQVDFSLPFPFHPRQLVVWYFPMDPISRGNAHPVLLTKFNNLDRYLPGIYSNDFNARYRPLANRLVVLTGGGLARAIFQYRVLLTNTSNTVIINTPEVLRLEVAAIQTDLTEILFKAAQPMCLVNVGMTSKWVTSLDCAIYGLGSNSDKVCPVTLLASEIIPVTSIGQGEFRVFLDQLIWMQAEAATVHFTVKMLCPSKLISNDFAKATNRGHWRYAPVKGLVWVLPMPEPVQGKPCELFISSALHVPVLTSCVDSEHRRLWTMPVNNWFPIPLGNCSNVGGRMVLLQSNPDEYSGKEKPFELGYRVECETDGASLRTVPFPRLGHSLKAESTWKPLPKLGHLTIDASSSGCQVELFFPTLDANGLRIFEDLNYGKSDDLMGLDDYAYLVPKSFHSPVLKTQYLSCTSRMYLAKTSRVDDHVATFSGARFRQVCLNEKARSSCGKKMLNLVATTEWQTLRVDADMNMNQLRQNVYTIENPQLGTRNEFISSSRLKLQLEFTSVVTESWRGFELVTPYYGDYANLETTNELHGVIINHKYLAIAGKSYLFGNSSTVDIRVLPVKMNSFKKGDHIFEVRFRLVDAKQALRERDQGQIIIANNTVQTFRFSIPKQFSAANAAKIYRTSFGRFPANWDIHDHYTQTDAGVLPVWSFKHHYRFEPADSKCRVVLKFTEMDIGSGYLARRYSSEQHRLSVLRDGDIKRVVTVASKSCQSTLTNPNAWNNSAIPICARMDQTYVSAKNSSSLVVFFRSAQFNEILSREGVEYEFLSDTYSDGYFDFMEYQESTWGRGWTVTYRQVCDDHIADRLGRDGAAPFVIEAKSSKWRTMGVLPGLPSMSELSLFLTRKYIFRPANPSACAIDFSIRTPRKARYLWSIDRSRRNRLGYEFISITVTGILPRVIPSITYRAKCSVIPSETAAPFIAPTSSPLLSPTTSPFPFLPPTASSPTSSPIPHPTSSPTRGPPRRDGETCSQDSDCLSNICSTLLHRCTSIACNKGQCAPRSNTPIGCASYSSIGCSCVWTGVVCQAVP